MSEIIEKVKEELLVRCKKHEEKVGYDFWNEHIKFVVKNAVKLADEFGADKEIVELGALLHDIAMPSGIGPREEHHIYGEKIAEELLTEYGYPKDKIERVKKCVLNHRGMADFPRNTIEEECIADADVIAHFDCLPSMFNLAFKEHGMSIPEGTEFVKKKLQRDYNKLSERTRVLLKDLDKCPICKQDISKFVEVENSKSTENSDVESLELAYDKNFAKSDKDIRQMDAIHQMAITGESIVAAMYTDFPMPNWDDILLLGCQLNPQPLESDVEVNTQTIIGKNAKKPLIIESPIYITHMSFGALSRETKIALAKGSAAIKTAQCSGEGGILVDEMDSSYRYIFEYVPNKYSATEDNLKNADAIEIKIGQSTKPGLGGQLQGEKVTSEIAEVRGKPIGEDIHSPSTIPGISTKEDLKELVDDLRHRSKGRPIGLKFAAGHIEDDLEHVLYAEPDFITIDGRGGSTGASPQLVRDSTSVPTIYALSRARKFLDNHNSEIDLTITGGLRVSSDFAKALAMGANAIAIGTGAMIAAACQQ